MIKFKLTPEPVWVAGDHPQFDATEIGSYPKEERRKVQFLIYPLTPQILRRALKNPDDDERDAEILDQIVRDWKGVVDESGKPIPCTKQNKVALLNGGYPLMGGAIVRIASELMSKFEEYKREEEKNLNNSSSGSAEGSVT